MLQLKMFNYILTFFVIFSFFGCSSNENGTVEIVTTPLSDECNVQDFTTLTSQTSNPMLVILLSYNNVKISSNINVWGEKIFSKNDGSLNHYFQEISNNKFEFSQATECKGIASVSLNKNHPNIDIDSFSFDSLVYPDLSSALTILDEKISFDIYDTNGDSKITPDELLFTFIIAGYEDSYEGRHVTNGVWAHQYCTDDDNAPTLDGVTLMGCSSDGNYALFGEKHDIYNPHDATIGTIAHELGHSAFSLPDLYDTSAKGGGIGYFGLMGEGTWAYTASDQYAGSTPTHMSAWSKIYNDWAVPDSSTGNDKTVIETHLNNSNIYKVPIDDSNYYLIENRNNNGYDKGLYSLYGTFNGGLAIWKIDETIINNNLEDNTVNNGTSIGINLIEAAGISNHERNLFYSTNVDSFEPNNPHNITSISSRGEVMTLDIN